MSPSAGRMRPNTRLSGIFKTKRSRPVSTSMLTRMLVPKPKNAFQSPDVHSAGLNSDLPAVPVDVLMRIPLCGRNLHRLQYCGGVRDPAEDAALGLDHLQAHLVKLGEVRRAAIRDDDAAIAAVIGLAHGGVDAHFGGDAAHEQILDAVLLQHVGELGGVERALAGLVDHDFAVERIELGDDVVTGLAANEDAAHRPGIADTQRW